MSVLQRAASIAATLACAFGLASANTPGQAAELAHLSVPTLAPPNIPSEVAVPSTESTGSDDADATVPPTLAAPHYASLAAAVDAQVVGDAVSDELNCLASAIYFEAKGEPLPGQLAVANVIINRARSGRYPPGLCGVVTQPGQFSFVHGGQMPAVDTDSTAYRTAMKLAKVAMAEAWDSPAPKALYFHARRVGMSRGATQIAMIGNHIFYR